MGQTCATKSCLLTNSPLRSSQVQSATSERHGVVDFQQKELGSKQAKRPNEAPVDEPAVAIKSRRLAPARLISSLLWRLCDCSTHPAARIAHRVKTRTLRALRRVGH